MKNLIEFLNKSIKAAQRCTEISNDYLKGYVDAMNETKKFIFSQKDANTPKPVSEARKMAKGNNSPFANYINYQLNDEELLTLLYIIGLDDENEVKQVLQRVAPRVRFGYLLFSIE